MSGNGKMNCALEKFKITMSCISQKNVSMQSKHLVI